MVKNPFANAGDKGSIPGLGHGKATLISLPGKFHGQRSLEGYSPWCYKELDTTEHSHYDKMYCKTFQL